MELELYKPGIYADFPASEFENLDRNDQLTPAQHFDPGQMPDTPVGGNLLLTRYTLDELHQLAPSSSILEKESGSELARAIFDIFPCFRCDIEATRCQIINGYPANFWLSCLFLIDVEKRQMVGIETDKLTVLSACFQAYNEQPHIRNSLDIETSKFFQLYPAMLTHIKHDSQQYLKKERISGGFLLLKSSSIISQTKSASRCEP